VYLTYSPNATQESAGILTATDTTYSKTGYVSLSPGAVVLGTTDSLNPTSLTFSLRSVGSTSITQTVTLSNTGTVALKPTIALIGANPGDYVITNNCPASVTVGSSCSFAISFAPTAAGTRTAAVQITSNAVSSPDVVQLSGSAQ
jgi:hypothetical protein